jgi:hypothetical protein
MESRSMHDWFVAIERKLKGVSQYTFYLLFPQLVRNLREQNKAKIPMDNHYAQRLRSLPASRNFIFHQLSSYSELIEHTRQEVEAELTHRLEEKEIDLEEYATFLK